MPQVVAEPQTVELGHRLPVPLTLQFPAPSQLMGVSVVPVHEEPQKVPDAGMWHWPAPSQLPSNPQGGARGGTRIVRVSASRNWLTLPRCLPCQTIRARKTSGARNIAANAIRTMGAGTFFVVSAGHAQVLLGAVSSNTTISVRGIAIRAAVGRGAGSARTHRTRTGTPCRTLELKRCRRCSSCPSYTWCTRKSTSRTWSEYRLCAVRNDRYHRTSPCSRKHRSLEQRTGQWTGHAWLAPAADIRTSTDATRQRATLAAVRAGAVTTSIRPRSVRGCNRCLVCIQPPHLEACPHSGGREP